MISRSFERPNRTVSRASDARNRHKIRYTTNQHQPTSRQVNDHGRVSGTHTLTDFEFEIARVHGERGQRGTADLLGVAHTTYARWMRGGLSEKLCRVVERLEAVVERFGTREYPEPAPEPEPGLKYQKIEVSSERVVRKGRTIVIYLPEPSGDPEPPREDPEPPPASP